MIFRRKERDLAKLLQEKVETALANTDTTAVDKKIKDIQQTIAGYRPTLQQLEDDVHRQRFIQEWLQSKEMQRVLPRLLNAHLRRRRRRTPSRRPHRIRRADFVDTARLIKEASTTTRNLKLTKIANKRNAEPIELSDFVTVNDNLGYTGTTFALWKEDDEGSYLLLNDEQKISHLHFSDGVLVVHEQSVFDAADDGTFDNFSETVYKRENNTNETSMHLYDEIENKNLKFNLRRSTK